MNNTVEMILKTFNLDGFDDVKKYLYTVSSDCLRKSYDNGIYYLEKNNSTNSKIFLVETLELLDIYVKYESKNYTDSLMDNMKKIKDLIFLKRKTSTYRTKYSNYLSSISEDIKNINVNIEIDLKPKFKDDSINDLKEDIEFVSLRKEGE